MLDRIGLASAAGQGDIGETLRDSAAYLRLVLEATGLGIWDFNPRKRELFCSNACNALFGLPPGAASYDALLGRIHPEDRRRSDRALRRALTRPRYGDRFVLDFRAGGGEERELWLAARGKVFFGAGRAERFLGIVFDITRRKLTERRLEQQAVESARALAAAGERLNAEIDERLAAEHTARQAQKEEAIGQLTGGIAHDFNNLLTVIQGNLELLRDRHVESAGGRRLLDGAARAAERGAKLTRQLLAFARRQRLAPRPVDIGGVMRAMADLLSRTIGPRIAIEIAPAPDLWPALVDPGQLEHALLNLALNARDAMPEGGTLRLGAANGDRAQGGLPADLAAGDYIVLSVSDTGTGMGEEVVAHACDPFFTTKDVGAGAGLGLSQVHGIAKQSGGTVRLQSRLGEGTTAEIFLPRA